LHGTHIQLLPSNNEKDAGRVEIVGRKCLVNFDMEDFQGSEQRTKTEDFGELLPAFDSEFDQTQKITQIFVKGRVRLFSIIRQFKKNIWSFF
jgi:hypothetical protein